MQHPIFDLGISLILFIQNLGEWLAGPMRAVSFLGDEEFFLMIMPILYWCVDAALGLRLGLILLISAGLNHTLKLLFHAPRPFFYDRAVQTFDTETTFGAPSGHAQNSASVWGLMAALLSRRQPSRKALIWGLTLLLVFVIGFSRLYVGMHFPTDVLLGWAAGFALVWGFRRLESPIAARLKRLSLGESIVAVFGASLVLVLISTLARLSLGAWTLPQGWLELAALAQPDEPFEPLALAGIFTSAGAVFGLGAGALWLRASGGFDAGGETWKRLARYPIGVVGVVLLWFGLGEIFPRDEALLSYVLRYLRYALVGLWISGAAPALFIRLGLAHSEQAGPSVQAPASQIDHTA